jgi:sugar phosphate isomerase/epimerase
MNSPVTRRTALKRLALAGAGLPLLGGSGALRAAEKAATAEKPPGKAAFNLGVAAYSVRGLPLEQALQAVRRVGLDTISVHKTHLPWDNAPPGWAASLEKFKAAGVTPLCCGVIYLKNNEAEVRNACEYARTLGVSLMACTPDPDALPLLERYLKQYDLRAAIHNHGPENKDWPSPHEVWKAIQPFDARIGLCIDVGHTYRAGADPVQTIRDYRSRLYDLHMKDSAAPVGAVHDIPVEVGRGHLDLRGIMQALVDIGYRQNVWFEYEKDAADPVPGLAESVGYIRGLLRGMAVV